VVAAEKYLLLQVSKEIFLHKKHLFRLSVKNKQQGRQGCSPLAMEAVPGEGFSAGFPILKSSKAKNL